MLLLRSSSYHTMPCCCCQRGVGPVSVLFDMIHHRVRFPNDVPLVLDLEYYYIHAANTARFRRTWNLASPSGAFGLNCNPSPPGQVQCASNHHHASKEELGGGQGEWKGRWTAKCNQTSLNQGSAPSSTGSTIHHALSTSLLCLRCQLRGFILSVVCVASQLR